MTDIVAVDFNPRKFGHIKKRRRHGRYYSNIKTERRPIQDQSPLHQILI